MVLPKIYAISDSKISLDNLSKKMLSKKKGDLMQVRAKKESLTNIKKKLQDSIRGNVLINSSSFDDSDIQPFLGIHLTSLDLFNVDLIKQMKRQGAKCLSASCHNEEEIEQANEVGCNFITLSPVHQASCHPDAPTLGWEKFSQLATKANMPVYALGGQTLHTLQTALKFGGYGVAGISGFW